MKGLKFSKAPLVRAVAIISVISLLVTGVTYAALQSQQVSLTKNTIQSATAGLEIGTSATSFSSSRTGFQFDDVIPGGPAMPTGGDIFYLKNNGTAPLQVSLNIPAAPDNTSGINLDDVLLHISRTDSGSGTDQVASLKSLIDGNLALNDTLEPGVTGQYTIRVSMATDAFDGSSASLGAFD
ncbi:MAG TPA: hypothetical protein VF261_03195, partial [Candidatus Saccharimonadales bacterium]